MNFVATKFNPETDPSRPIVGGIVEKDGKSFIICKVEHRESKDIMKIVISGIEPDKEGHDEVLFDQHKERPFVYWMVWVNEKK